MTDNPHKPDPIARYRAVLETLDPRLRQAAKLRALYPLIEPQVAAGVPHAAIIEDLAAAGLPVRRNTYITTLRRWRRARRQATEQANPATALANLANEPGQCASARPSPTPLDAIQGRPSRIQTPADLRKIRDMRIDLDALRREGLASRAKASQDTQTHNDKE